MNHPHALIIGGGIGGLAAALALRGAGWAVSVYERALELREVGAGLALWANAVRALDKLGVAGEVRALRPPAPSGGVYTWRGEPLAVASAEALERRVGEVSVVVHRAELLEILGRALGAGVVTLGKQCVAVAQDERGVTARFADGTEARGELLVGADGIGSVVRALTIADGAPVYAGYTSWRAVVSFDPQQMLLGEYWGCGARFGMAQMSGGRVYWYATRNAPAGGRGAPEAERALVEETFRGWCAPIEALIAATPAEHILRHDIADREPVRRWSTGRITLLGDAAHPMTPNLGQGACQALEDAVVLAECLRTHSDCAVALRAYEERRIPRTSQIVRQSRRIGQVAQWSHPLACRLRDTLVRLGAPVQARMVDAVVGYQV